LTVFVLGALLPDIDRSTSFIGRRVKVFGWIFRHRGVFHSLSMLLLLSGVLYILFLDRAVAYAFALGYASHLLIDGLSREGVRLFFPLPWRLKGPVRVNGLGEKSIFIVSLVFSIILVLR